MDNYASWITRRHEVVLAWEFHELKGQVKSLSNVHQDIAFSPRTQVLRLSRMNENFGKKPYRFGIKPIKNPYNDKY